MRPLFSLALIRSLLFPLMLCAQQEQPMATIVGEITDLEGIPLSYATVMVEGSNLYVATSTLEGVYELSVPANKTFTLVCTYLGFKDYKETNIYLAPEGTIRLDISMISIMATGYVACLDLQLNGELIDGLESWINLSFLSAREAFEGINHGVRKLVGQKIDIVWTSDVPKAPWAQVNLALTVGSGLPFGIPKNNVQFRNSYAFQVYHRIDIGASFSIWDRKLHIKNKYNSNKTKFKKKSSHSLRSFKRIWLSFEVFNLMDAKNVASNTWVKDFSNRSYAISNTLSSRRLNIRFKIDF